MMRIEKPKRNFLPQQLEIESWQRIQPFFENLVARKISDFEDLKKWLFDRSELEAAISEDLAWRYIKMTCDTTDDKIRESFEFFVNTIEPEVSAYSNKLNTKLIECEFTQKLDKNTFSVYIRGVKKALEIFREENIPLLTKISTESQKYGAISGAMTIEWQGEQITLQKASSFYKDTKRITRENIFNKIQSRRDADKDTLNKLFSELIQMRHQVALNAGFENYRDYKFAELGRFDYTTQDCFHFHDSIKNELVPIVEEGDKKRRQELNLQQLKPWDMDVDTQGRKALKPFDTADELVSKSIECFYRIRKSYGEVLEIMKEMKHFDLESRIGKAPGGYNYPLYEIGVPFIFMNSVGTLRDLVTMVHEGGHAIHSFFTRDLQTTDLKSFPSEVAELASMSMELISMEHWDIFFDKEEDLKRAKTEQLEQTLDTLLWIAAIDKFQHWIYTNPKHTVNERMKNWEMIFKEFSSAILDWSGLDNHRARMWQNQLHLFEVPFYYIEYGMAQLGAIAVWRNYKNNPEQALNNYDAALKLGYTKTIPEIYKAAGIEFNFTQDYVRELTQFVKSELNKL
jgi:oligoendopeptidase F